MDLSIMRSTILNCVRDDSDLPAAYRWLYKYHVAESISQFSPYVTRYSTYRALPVPPDGEDFGAYNWIMTEHYWLLSTVGMPGLVFGEHFTKEFMEMTRQPTDADLRDPRWRGTREGYHPIVYVYHPILWEKDFKGAGRTIEDGANFRWLIVFKYPEGVSKAEGDDWFLNKLAPQITAIPEVNRFVSSAILDQPRTSPFIRIAEIWFDNSKKWHKAMVENGTAFTKPAWAKYQKFPYLEPYQDFTGIFVMDRPESDHLSAFRGYITTR
jgi:hypothetical protein